MIGNLPTLAETFAGFETVARFGLFAPTDTPKAVVEHMNQAVRGGLGHSRQRHRRGR